MAKLSGDPEMKIPESVSRVARFVIQQLEGHRSRHAAGARPAPPLFVGVQGPQGSGKSFLTDLMPRVLTAAPHNLRLASLSLDDLYLPHKEQTELSSRYPSNRMLSGRGQPGTHDLPLAVNCLRRLASINEGPPSATIELPIYDKSCFSGKGDRSKSITPVIGPIDVVIFEGWATGFHSIPSSELQQRYQQAQQDPVGYAKARYSYDKPFFLEHELSHLEQINEFTNQYQRELWLHLDCFVQLKPEDMGFVWRWRLQQEHNMKAKNGGVGMSDDEVKAFIGRYMPGYELFLDGLSGAEAPWRGRGYRLVLDADRAILREEGF